MKSKTLLVSLMINLIFIVIIIYSFKTVNNPDTGTSFFIAEYTVGQAWKEDLDYHEQNYSSQHSRFLSSLREKGIIDFGARYSDKGIVVFHSTDINAAQSLLTSDTAVVNNLFNVEVNELSLFYEGCIKTKNQNQEAMKNKKVTGIGGIFFKCKNPQEMKDWYKKHLGFDTDEYGTNFEWRQGADPEKYGFTQWGAFSETTKYFQPSTKEFMINYRVENLEALVEELKKEGVTFTDEIESFDYGKFVHIMDVEGNKVELWEPNDVEYDKIVGGRTK